MLAEVDVKIHTWATNFSLDREMMHNERVVKKEEDRVILLEIISLKCLLVPSVSTCLNKIMKG